MLIRLCLISFLGLVAIFFTETIQAEVSTSVKERLSLQLTVYNSNFALVKDRRVVDFHTGVQRIKFSGIPRQIQPESVFLGVDGVSVLEHNYSGEVLSPEALLRNYVGKEVKIIRVQGDDEEEYEVQAKVLSVAGGVVLQIDNKIETAIDGRIIFPSLPENLHPSPHLTMLVESSEKGEREAELMYLTQGLSWKADYIARLNRNKDRLDLQGWATVINNSDIAFEQTKLQLVAGDVQKVQPVRSMMVVAESQMSADSAKGATMGREALLAYQLYSVARPVSLLPNQTKQIGLLQENNAKCRQEYVLNTPSPHYYWSRVGNIAMGEGVEVILQMKNDQASNLGLPKPAGIVRVYHEDARGTYQFLGEDSIPHTPENRKMSITLGKSFDITADRVQTDFSLVRGETKHQRIHESGYNITIHNGKDEDVEVRVVENIPGDWQILSESQHHTKVNAAQVEWLVKVVAKGQTELRYRVRQIME